LIGNLATSRSATSGLPRDDVRAFAGVLDQVIEFVLLISAPDDEAATFAPNGPVSGWPRSRRMQIGASSM